MDPQSQSFTPYNNSNSSSGSETWRLQTDVVRLQQLHAEHSERIARLERRQDEDARMKSVWGNSSPFPSVLSGTPQQAPLRDLASEHFRGFGDDDGNTLMSSLHLDAEDEPRRGLGAASRANSVRFDESANQNHFSHSSRASMDFMSRTSSGLGGLQMTERSSSHKSDGRASSAHSMRSAASGRANSLNLDSGYGLGDSNRSPIDHPALAPGLLLLGSVPAIIRCWMNTNFRHDALLYAAVCTGSYKSYLDLRLIQRLGFESDMNTEADGVRTVQLPVFFPEAVPHPASSRSSSPAPQLPTVTVTFQVVEASPSDSETKAIQIFLGSDTLRAHSADILFSSNSMTLFDDERSKLSIPLVRPENESAFKSLTISSGAPQSLPAPVRAVEQIKEQPYINGQGSSGASLSSAADSPPPGRYRPPGAIAAEAGVSDSTKAGVATLDNDVRPASRSSNASRPSLNMLNTQTDVPVSDPTSDTVSQPTPSRTGSSPATWGSWRRDGVLPTTQSTNLDWANASKSRENAYQRKETGIKVLKPKSVSRTFSVSTSASPAAAPSPSDGKSRFFDEGRRRSGPDDGSAKVGAADSKKEGQAPGGALAASGGLSAPNSTATAPPKTKSNPIGGASAFSWLNSGGGAK